VKTGRHESEARYVARAYGISVKQLRTYGFNRFMQLSPTARQVVLNDMRRSSLPGCSISCPERWGMTTDYFTAGAALAFFLWLLVAPHYYHKASVQLRNEMTEQEANDEAL